MQTICVFYIYSDTPAWLDASVISNSTLTSSLSLRNNAGTRHSLMRNCLKLKNDHCFGQTNGDFWKKTPWLPQGRYTRPESMNAHDIVTTTWPQRVTKVCWDWYTVVAADVAPLPTEEVWCFKGYSYCLYGILIPNNYFWQYALLFSV